MLESKPLQTKNTRTKSLRLFVRNITLTKNLRYFVKGTQNHKNIKNIMNMLSSVKSRLRMNFEPTELGYMLNLENKKSKKQKITDKDYRKLKIK